MGSLRAGLNKAGQSRVALSSVEQLDRDGGLRQNEFMDNRTKIPFDQDCLTIVRELQKRGRYGEALIYLVGAMDEEEKKGSLKSVALACVWLSELLNKWGAASEYTDDLVAKACSYSVRAVEILRMPEHQDSHVEEGALFWKAQNFATLCRLGGNDEYDCQTASNNAENAAGCLELLSHLEPFDIKEVLSNVGRTRRRFVDTNGHDAVRFAVNPGQITRCSSEIAPNRSRRLVTRSMDLESRNEFKSENMQKLMKVECKGRAEFVRGVVLFCQGEAVKNKCLKYGSLTHTDLVKAALYMFERAHETFNWLYGDINFEVAKILCMAAISYKLLGNIDEAIELMELEIEIRENVQGKRHPRTRKAREALACLKGEVDERIQSAFARRQMDPIFLEHELDPIDAATITWDVNPFIAEEEWLVDASFQMYVELGLLARFNIRHDDLLALILRARNGYRYSNPFHSWQHAWSVAHVSFMVMRQEDVARCMTDVDRLVVLLSCLLHDIDHPGFNNDYLIKSASPLALKYPVPNPLEEHHCALAIHLLTSSSVLDNSAPNEREEVLHMLRDGIMATDMRLHKSISDELQASVERIKDDDQPPYDKNQMEDRTKLVRLLVHACDLSGQTLQPTVAYEFGKRVLEEFSKQHRSEVEEGLPESTFMKDLHTPLAQAKAQLGFLHYVIKPLWFSLSIAFPSLHFCHENVQNRIEEIDFMNLDSWPGLNAKLIEEGTKFPIVETSEETSEEASETSEEVIGHAKVVETSE